MAGRGGVGAKLAGEGHVHALALLQQLRQGRGIEFSMRTRCWGMSTIRTATVHALALLEECSTERCGRKCSKPVHAL